MTDRMEDWQPAPAARWLAEAIETGNPLAALPLGIAPRGMEEGEAIAFATLEQLGFTPCGLRLGPGGVAGPMLEGRLLRDGAPVALPMLRYPSVSAAVIGVLAEPLEAETDAEPVFSALHPALDIAASRFTEAPEDPALVAADLGGLGLVVAGRAKRVGPGRAHVALGVPESRARGEEHDLAAALSRVAAAARRLGGLPAGSLLVAAGLSAPVRPEAGSTLAARIGGLGRAAALFAD